MTQPLLMSWEITDFRVPQSSHHQPLQRLVPWYRHPVRCFMITTQGDVCILNLHKYTWLSECIYREFSLWIIWTCWKRKRGKSWCREGCAHHYLVTYSGFWEMCRCFLMSPKLFLKPLPHLCSLPYKNALLMGTIQIIFSGKSFIIYNWWTGWVVLISIIMIFVFFFRRGSYNRRTMKYANKPQEKSFSLFLCCKW